MEALEQLAEIFTRTTATTTTTGFIPTDTASPREQRDAPVPRVPNRSTRVQISPTTVLALVVEHPQATENSTP